MNFESPLVARIFGPSDLDTLSDGREAPVPLALLLLERALDASSGVVHGGLSAYEDGCIVQEGPEERARDRTTPGAPEPVAGTEGGLGTVTEGEEGKTGTKVTRRVHLKGFHC